MKTREETALLSLPAKALSDPHHASVFYNKRMAFNRTVSSLAVGAAISLKLAENNLVCDGLCASGVRGIRYALENKGIKKIFFVDANPDAIKATRKNIVLNKLKKAVVVENDFNRFLVSTHEKFGFVEIDPFGSPTNFLENAFRALGDKAVLSVTATDLATTAGSRPKPCERRYGAKPLKNEFAHETALRILLGKIVRTAAAFDYGVKPLASFYEEHYVKVVGSCEKSAAKADESLDGVGFVNYCRKCLNRSASTLPEKTCDCGARFEHAGPLWVKATADESFLKKMLELNDERAYSEKNRATRFLDLLMDENGLPPYFFDLHFLAKKFGGSARKTGDVVAALERTGFRATRTHYSGTGIKTSAGITRVKSVLKKP